MSDSYGGQIITAPFDHGTKANEKIIRVKPGQLAYGLGCKKYPDCFSCPFPDCTWSSNESYSAKGTQNV